ncbi:hypothetical protein [Pseudoalteromonas sp. SR41-6]|jgi:hypothetical protein|uniref:hypothetical protein n=1 Tax=Pseudoalteromonas sp. SR41-6 TaxID=2760948 RepID=UPI000C991348|nr:hypothetical protein [Pseudoalteromonas sp. SR41-6]MAD75994.1 hypothetical protein [Rheinheimera sp.]MBB1333962.1 hypothetical protein [Pseudoalteromonas sp. SR41-6]|tara:strand:- start:783 stop:1076 length:294 start_codon:yes stop_codon:yes gene_type:complete
MNSIRFSFIEAMINVHGSIKRCHLCRAFGVTEPTATRIFKEYRVKYPKNIVLDQSSKSYKKSDSFKVENLKIEANEFLNAAQIMSENLIVERGEKCR